MNAKLKKAGGITATAVPSIIIGASGLGKLIGVKSVVEKLQGLGVGPFVAWLGIMEIAFALLFVFPKTMPAGLILLSCYFGGAIATDLSHGGTVVPAMMLLLMVWIVAVIRDRSLFGRAPRADFRGLEGDVI